MIKIWLISFVCLGITSILKAQTVKLFHEKKDQGYIIYATSSDLYPSSVSLNLNLTNLVFSEGERKIFVIPAKSEKFKIGELTVADKGSRYTFNFTFLSAIGDVTITDYDRSFQYDLPYQKGKSYQLYQGYNGSFSHQNENALDFTMPEGTEVLAARDGIVVEVITNNTESCPEEVCKKYNNSIMIMHADGTFARYLHIKYNGSKFNAGDAVKRGDVIAYSGNVGWTSGPHLHFVCFLGSFGKWKTLETKFRIDKGSNAILLKEGTNYLRDY